MLLLSVVLAAFATETVSATLTKGVTASQISSATSPVTLATFTYKAATFTVACKGAAPALACTIAADKGVKSSGDKTASITGGSGTTIHAKFGTTLADIAIPSSPVMFDGCVIDNGSGM